jgi:histidine triad (HIT) family protein
VTLAGWAFALARRGGLDPLVRFAFSRAAFLLPLRRVLETPRTLIFHHPRPAWPTHLLLVPKRAIPSYRHVTSVSIPLLAEIVRLAPTAAELARPRPAGYALLLNGGRSQEVGQLHVHLAWPIDSPVPESLPGDVLRTDTLCVSRHPRPRRRVHLVISPLTTDLEQYLTAAFAWLQTAAQEMHLDEAGFTLILLSDRLPVIQLLSGPPDVEKSAAAPIKQ